MKIYQAAYSILSLAALPSSFGQGSASSSSGMMRKRPRGHKREGGSGDSDSGSSSDDGPQRVCLQFGDIETIEGTTTTVTGNIATFVGVDPASECNAGDPSIPSSASPAWLATGGATCPFYRAPFLINRDPGVDSQFIFEDVGNAPLGTGALCGGPGDDDPIESKFILEYFGDLSAGAPDFVSNCVTSGATCGNDLYNKPLGQLQDVSYDFYVKGCQDSKLSCPEQFYFNVFVRKAPSSPTTFYDCNFAYLTTNGGTPGSWNTVNLPNILNQPSAVTFTFSGNPDDLGCNVEGGNRATTLQEYLASHTEAVLSNNALYTFQWNIGDSTADLGLSGCYDNIRIKLADEGATRIYNFEPDTA